MGRDERMVRQLFILFVIFGINSAMNVERKLGGEARNGDAVVATNRRCQDENGWVYCTMIVLSNLCDIPVLGLRQCGASCGDCCGNSHYPRCGEIATWQVCNVGTLRHLCR